MFTILNDHLNSYPTEYCGGKPADLVFVMDSSGSISSSDFIKQKEFITGMVDLFETDTGKIRVGVVTYSNWAFLEFNLNTYTNKSDIKASIEAVRHYKGDTNTGSAIAYMRDVMFQEHNGARDGVPRIAIVLTDGRSNDPVFTVEEATKAKQEDIVMFAIGVGSDKSMYELTGIASDPDDQYVFQVADYTALQYIKTMLAIETCKGMCTGDHKSVCGCCDFTNYVNLHILQPVNNNTRLLLRYD